MSRIPLADLVSVLRCPVCCSSSDLAIEPDSLVCPTCLHRFPLVDGVPALLAHEREVAVLPVEHQSNQIDPDVGEWLESLPGWSLNIGAGATVRPPTRCIELEYSVFRHTTVVGDAHRLPFKDATFDAVVSYNTFEHLAAPEVAANEILRVLKPGGRLRLQTAFLQPLHEAPAHFYNATEFGVRRWFGGFDIDHLFVPGNMSPVYALGWICSALLWHVGGELGEAARARVAETNLPYWDEFWNRRGEATGPAAEVNSLSDPARTELAFGHEIVARAPDARSAGPRTNVDISGELVEILACPRCGGALSPAPHSQLRCQSCASEYGSVAGVPVLLAEDHEVGVVALEHESNPIADDVLDWLQSFPGWTLNLGAGATTRPIPSCVELEYQVFKNTSVVGDAHRLPFQDAVFDAVVSWNTFEHLADPERAAAEILRVLKPGGTLRLRSAFLQPLHEEPAHFYNATEFGMRRWFADFEIDSCTVPHDMGPAQTLGWLANHLLFHIRAAQGPEMERLAGQLRLSQFARFWEVPSTRSGFLRVLFDQMPDRLSHFSAGFEVRAHRPESAAAAGREPQQT